MKVWSSYLVVSVLDSVEVEDGERVGGDEAGEGQDLVHLDRRHLHEAGQDQQGPVGTLR